jgi:protein O-GlcNAc transferase
MTVPVDDVEALFSEALGRFQARDATGAEPLLRRVLAAAPDHVPSLSLLAQIAGRAGRDAECVGLLERAVAHGAAQQAAMAGLWLGAAHRRAGRTRDAIGALRAAVEADPDLAAAHGALSAALYAIDDLAGAAAHAEAAARLTPADGACAGNLAVVRNAQGRYAEAADLCRAALAAREDPALLNTLGVSLKELGELSEAAASLERAISLRPDFHEARYNLAGVRKDEGRTDDAVALLRQAVALNPELPAARFALCMAHLAPLYTDDGEIDRRRADYAKELDALCAYADRVGPGALAAGVGASQPFYLAYQGRKDGDLQRRYGELVCRAMGARSPAEILAPSPQPGERLRVGIVSGYFRDHSVWRLPTRGWVEGLDRAQFELAAFHTGATCDAETDRARGLFERFVQGPLALEAWRREIADFRPHALIYPEIGMDPTAVRLAALRLAPAQYSSWGHPSTTGFPTIDFYLSSDAMEPAGAETHYTEALVRLPGLSTRFDLPGAVAPVPPRAALGLPEDAIVYWCCQSLYKYLPAFDGVFAEIAARVPSSRFVFIEFPDSPPLTERFRDRLAAAFAGQGLDARRHCVLLPRMTPAAFQAAMGCADVMLDSIGWSGCNSVLDAFACGLPVVSLPGETMRSRHAAAMLGAVGIEDLICATRAEYVDVAVALGLDKSARAAFGRRLKEGLGGLAQTAGTAALARHLVATARRSHGPEPSSV